MVVMNRFPTPVRRSPKDRSSHTRIRPEAKVEAARLRGPNHTLLLLVLTFLVLMALTLTGCFIGQTDTLEGESYSNEEGEDDGESVDSGEEASGDDDLSAAERRVTEHDLPLDQLTMPEGFEVAVYARVPNARSMTLSPNGVLYVGNRQGDKVYAVTDADDNGTADQVRVIDEGLRMPNGVAWKDGSLYVAEVSRILRYDGIDERLDDPPELAVVYDGYPTDRHHGWKFIAFGPDGWLYVPVGAPCNVCDPDEEIYSTITRIRPDGTGREIYARGVRNTVGFDWHPDTGELWFTDTGRDMMGDDIPPDELNRAPEAGMHFGFPWCHGGDVQDPEFDQRPCSELTPPVVRLGPHVAALGMRFYTGDMFPAEYRGDVFHAEHGSWNRSNKIGYRVMRTRVGDDGSAITEPFVEGWLQGENDWGRPVDVQQMPDGALLISDDATGTIYRLTYSG